MTREETQLRPVRVGLISLGCAKNLVDAEIMLGTLLRDGVEITNDVAQADAVIVNTCSFIDSAQEESVDAILESAQRREARSRRQALVVAGCLPQRFRDELPRLLPEVDAFMGVDQVAQVAEIVRRAVAHRAERIGKHRTANIEHPTSKARTLGRFAELGKGGAPSRDEEEVTLAGTKKFWSTQAIVSPIQLEMQDARAKAVLPLVDVSLRPTFIPDYATPRFRLTPRHLAYVKIAEGCNHPCTFCTIPRMRGSHRSRPQRDIIEEARRLLGEGVKELNLISQDSTYYGLDLRPNASRAIASPGRFVSAVEALPAAATTLCTLLRELNALPGDFWIRILYTHPAHWTDELIRTMAECPKVARYVDLPLQHIHENMLERMRRETSRQHIVDLLGRIRAGVPGIALRTTFIVGFPGETEACFEALLNFIRAARFERLGVFAYSQEAGTRAGAMAGQVPDRIKRRRRDRAMAAQHEVAVKVSHSFVGRTIQVLVDGEADPQQLPEANLRSREHGFVRSTTAQDSRLKAQDYCVARGEADAPDIDGRVYVRGNLSHGEFAQVKVIGHTDYDLIATPAS